MNSNDSPLAALLRHLAFYLAVATVCLELAVVIGRGTPLQRLSWLQSAPWDVGLLFLVVSLFALMIERSPNNPA